MSERNVYIAFGFHINLYHSYRVDSNDEAGFGKDIRIIRKIIEVFDQYNKRGIPARAVWDSENLFSLQEILPKYAPDIVENLQRRVKEGDEVILMSYNNGLLSAMQEKEFFDSVSRSISNQEKSGIQDIFTDFSPIVRPQEMMLTAGNLSLYQKLKIQAISLYYSSITFDSFRVFSRPLSCKEAFNPLVYKNSQSGESMTVIPTYNIGDLVENVSLAHWVRKIHRKQRKGEIDSDVLLFINFDADDEYWYGYDFSFPPLFTSQYRGD